MFSRMESARECDLCNPGLEGSNQEGSPGGHWNVGMTTRSIIRPIQVLYMYSGSIVLKYRGSSCMPTNISNISPLSHMLATN